MGTEMKSVLVVDDNPLNGTLATTVLQRAGYEVHCVDRAELALEFLKSTRVDIVLTDIGMPGMSGKDLARILRECMQEQCPRLVAYTAYALEHQQQAIVDAGFDAIVIKPARSATLVAALEGHPSA